jgi:hypothetical protein
MYSQLPMQVSLMERKRERAALLREAEVLRALGNSPAPAAPLGHWLAAARERLAAMARPRARQEDAPPCRTKLGASAA